jgi:hypothetical protein
MNCEMRMIHRTWRCCRRWRRRRRQQRNDSDLLQRRHSIRSFRIAIKGVFLDDVAKHITNNIAYLPLSH